MTCGFKAQREIKHRIRRSFYVKTSFFFGFFFFFFFFVLCDFFTSVVFGKESAPQTYFFCMFLLVSFGL